MESRGAKGGKKGALLQEDTLQIHLGKPVAKHPWSAMSVKGDRWREGKMPWALLQGFIKGESTHHHPLRRHSREKGGVLIGVGGGKKSKVRRKAYQGYSTRLEEASSEGRSLDRVLL